MAVVFAEDCKNRGFVCLCVRLVNAVRLLKLLILVECSCSGA